MLAAYTPRQVSFRVSLRPDAVLEITDGCDAKSPRHIWQGSALEPPAPFALANSMTEHISFSVHHEAREGEIIGALRVVAMLLDRQPNSRCAVNAPSASFGVIKRAAKYVGLIAAADDSDLLLRRAECAPETLGLVSVLIAAYNPRYLPQALASVAAQTWKNLELIVCDDSDSDAIAELVAEFSNQHQLPVRYVKNPERIGVRLNYEQCFRLASGEFCKFLNDDDLLDATCVERMVNALRDHPSAHLATSHRRCIDARGRPLSDLPATSPVTRFDCYIDGLSLINALLMLGLNFVGEPTTTLFRSNRARMDDETLIEFLDVFGRGIADMVLWCKLALRGDCVFLADRLSSFRIHSEQQTQATNVSQRALTAIPELRERWLSTGMHESYPPNVLRTRPLAGIDDASRSAWGAMPFTLFVPVGQTTEQLISDWQKKRHPFFAQSSQ